jgi:hypothetical protein
MWTGAKAQIVTNLKLEIASSDLRVSFDFIVRLIAYDDTPKKDISQTVARFEGIFRVAANADPEPNPRSQSRGSNYSVW